MTSLSSLSRPLGFVTLKRSQPGRNLHRFYALALVEGLFAEWGVLREWGRVGSPGRVRIDWYPSQAEAEHACARLKRRKERKSCERSCAEGGVGKLYTFSIRDSCGHP